MIGLKQWWRISYVSIDIIPKTTPLLRRVRYKVAQSDQNNLQEYVAKRNSLKSCGYLTIDILSDSVLTSATLEGPSDSSRWLDSKQENKIREVFMHPYRIIYFSKESEVSILSVIHESRNLPDNIK